jgi:hypothetical protein
MADNSLENVALKYFSNGTQEYLLHLARRGQGRGKRKTPDVNAEQSVAKIEIAPKENN